MADKIHIIAEAGSNNNGDINKAKELVSIAKDAGADSVKFQIINPYGLYLPGDYEYGHYDIKDVMKIRFDGMMTDDEYHELNAFAAQQNIPFTASVFDTKGLDLYMKFNPPYVKLASCDLNNIRLLTEVAERGVKMIISTGMSSFSDIEKSMNALAKINFDNIVLLHCVSVYPSELKISNLNFITKLKNTFGFEVGFSDHTANSLASCMALAKGATWFEKHFTMDKTLDGFDHKHAQDPTEMKNYVQDLRDAEEAMSMPNEKISDRELYTRKRARRSLYAAKNLPVGHIITNEDVLVVRPEGILDADQIGDIVGQVVAKEIKQHQAYSFETLKS